MIGLALSGGGSRAIAFHLGCMRALQDLGVLQRAKVLSTVSGGSVIGALYAYTPEVSFDAFDTQVQHLLAKGLQKGILWETIKYLPLAVIKKVRHPRSPLLTRSDAFVRFLENHLFEGLKLSSPRRNNMAVTIGACDLHSGNAFRFGETRSGVWRLGELCDWSESLAFAVACSAAYPVFLPALLRHWSFQMQGQVESKTVAITDGGIYDNLGVQVLEPGRSPGHSLHTFQCKNIIACNAGQGQRPLTAKSPPNHTLGRLVRSFEIVHQRTQAAAMGRLHLLKKTNILEGFAMPYLGQLDERLVFPPNDLVPREAVIHYPTDFAPMTPDWIAKLANRGEQLTRLLVSAHLPHLF